VGQTTALLMDEGPVWRVTNGIFPSNCYIVGTGTAGECFLIDPGLDPAPIEAALAELRLRPHAICCTHGHFDHAGSAAVLQKRYDCPVYLDEADAKTLRSSNFLLMAFKIPARTELPATLGVRELNFEIRIGDRQVVYHPTPGHTPGSCMIECGSSLFTGDTLYSRGVGLSKLPGENAEQLRRSILSMWDRFAADVTVHPGHGDSARLDWVKHHNHALLRFLQLQPAPQA
jgi:hydroxyacylglutathione hydrolase